jgi:hypothetical protein
MKNDKIIVHTQFWDENGKPKGGQSFFFYTDADYLYNDRDLIIDAMQKLVDRQWAQHNFAGRCEVVSYEPVFIDEIELKGDFEAALTEVWEQRQKA